MIKKTTILFILLIITNCSFDTRSGIWTKGEDISKENDIKTRILFENEKVLKRQFNTDFIIKTPLLLNHNEIKAYSNNDYGIQNFSSDLKKISKYNFSKIKNFDYFDPKVVFDNRNIIFFDKKGSIINFDEKTKIVWKKNFYSKNEKKLLPVLNFTIKDQALFVSDNLSKYYLLNVKTGSIIWSREHNSTFISQSKIDDRCIYIIDASNIFNCFSLKDGEKIWDFKLEKNFIKSQKKLSIIYDEDKVYFNNSNGDIYALDKKNGNLVWLTPTKNDEGDFQTFKIKQSDLVLHNNQIYLSNNQNEFFSIDKMNGIINWTQNINSHLRPIFSKNLIFTISTEGYLFVIEKISGNILRVNYLFNEFSKKKRKKIIPEGFALNETDIFLTLNNGRILVIDIGSGTATTKLKVSRDKISKPFINNKKMFIIKEDQIIKLY